MSCLATTTTTTTSGPGHAERRCDVGAFHVQEAHIAVDEHHDTAERRASLHALPSETVIAALRPREAWPVIAVHEGLSPSSRRLRYSAPTRRLTPRMVRVLTDLRPGHHEAYAAWCRGRPIGIVRWIRTPDSPGAAELALEVVDAEQGAGVGRALAAFAAVQACRAGVQTMLVSVDPDNVRVHHWLSKLHARALPDDADRFTIPTHALFAAAPVARP